MATPGQIPERHPHQAYALLNFSRWAYSDPAVSLIKIPIKTEAQLYLPPLAFAHIFILGEKLSPRGHLKPILVDEQWDKVPYGWARAVLAEHRVALLNLPFYNSWWLDVSFSGTLCLLPIWRDPQRRVFGKLDVYLEPGQTIHGKLAQLTGKVDDLIYAQQDHLSCRLRAILGNRFRKIGT